LEVVLDKAHTKARTKKRKYLQAVGYLFLSLLLVVSTTYSMWGLILAPISQHKGDLPTSKPPTQNQDKKTYNVVKFGAKGDGRTNDRTAIQAAVDKASSVGGGTVFFPKGVYLIDNSILVNKSNVVLEGAGWGAEIRITTHPRRVIVIEGSSHNVVRNLQVSLGVADVSRNDEDEGIYVTSKATDFLIENVLGNAKGIMVRGQVSGGTIRNNTIKNSLADGIHITGGSKNIVIENNVLIETGDDAIAVVSYRSQQTMSSDITIKGNRIENSLSRGIAHVGGKKVVIIDNQIDGTASSGILVDEDHNYNTFAPEDTRIERNTIKRAGAYGTKRGNLFGIEVSAGSSSVSIIGNIVSEGASRGISVSADGTLIQDNTSSRNKESGLQVDSDNCTISGNLFENNGTFGFYSSGSDQLNISKNVWTNNNESFGSQIDNFVLKDSNHSIVTDNQSIETRVSMQVEHSYELVGSCSGLIFERNSTSGTNQGLDISCRQ
jgi:parallel beta-helix repeat protein